MKGKDSQSKMSIPKQTIKLVILGDSGVGKSSVALRFVSNEFRPYSESTIGASFMSKTISINNNKDNKDETETENTNVQSEEEQERLITFKIWDTAGQEKYRSLAPMYYRGAGAALLVFDITKQSSFHSIKSWVSELKCNGPSDITIALCGNKCDLVSDGDGDDYREVSKEEATLYAQKELETFYMETSARDAINIQEIFHEVAKCIPYTKEDQEEEQLLAEASASSEDIKYVDLGLSSSDNMSSTARGTCC